MKTEDDCGERSLSLVQGALYGAITMPIAMGGLVLVLFLPTHYAVELGIGLSAVGLVIGLGRIVDVVTDPLIGRWSDNTRSRWGPRRSWMLIALLPYLLAVWFFFLPPEGAGLLYLVFASSAYFLFFTAFDVPYSSIGLEISPNRHERTDIASLRAFFQVAGALLAAVLPVALKVAGVDALSAIAITMIALALVTVVLFWFFVPVHNRVASVSRVGVFEALKLAFREPGYRTLITAFMIIQISNAFPAALTVIFVTQVIQSPALINPALLLLIASSALFLPLWIVLSRYIGKRRTWMVSILMCCVALGIVPTLGAGNITAFLIVCACLGAAFGCDTIMPTSMLADIVYRTELRGNERMGATFLAAKNSVSKLAFVAPLLVAFPMLDLVGFDAGKTNAPSTLMWLSVFFALVPIGLRLIALMILQRAGRASHES